jgi:hypothetical protein
LYGSTDTDVLDATDAAFTGGGRTCASHWFSAWAALDASKGFS